LITRPEIIGELITQHESVFKEKDIARIINHYVDDGHDFQTILHGVKTSDEIIALKYKGDASDNIYYSTKEMIATEAEMIKLTYKLYEAKSHGIHPDFVNEAIKGQNKELKEKFGGRLSDEQIEAIKHITGKERLSTLVGYAGAGKSTALKAAREAWEAQGYKVHGAALAGKAAAGLEESSGIKSRTLHSYQYRWEHNDLKLNSNDVFVIDEAGMVGSQQMHYFLKEVQKAGAKIILVGDSGQRQPISAGGAFKAIEEITNPAKITEIRRQKQDWQRQASMDFANGNIETALKAYDKKGFITKSENEDEAITSLVEDYIADLKGTNSVKKIFNKQSDHIADDYNKQSSRLILAHRRKDVAKLNDAIREKLLAENQMSKDSELTYNTASGKKQFAKGDRFLFTKNDTQLNVKNGTLGTVIDASPSFLTVQPDGKSAKPIQIDINQYNHLGHGYAVTIHKSQGATVDKTWLLATKSMDQHLIYVAGTRHRERMKVYHSKSELNTISDFSRKQFKQNCKQTTHSYQINLNLSRRLLLKARLINQTKN